MEGKVLVQKCVHAALAAGVLMVAAVALDGQAVSGNIIGTVTDPTGAAVSGATVKITDVGKGVSYSATTNESGNYTQTQLTPGRYRVEVEQAGFKRVVQDNIPVNVGQSTRVDLALEVGAVNEEVTVTTLPPPIETDRAEVSTTMTTQQVENLPTFNRNFTSLQLLIPGTSKLPWQHAESENPQGGLQIASNGQQFSTTNFMLDGTDNNDPVLGIIVVNPTIDSVGQFKVATSNFDAEFAQAGGSVIQVETKSGTNEFHGSAFEFLQNNVFQARDPFTQGLHEPGTPAPPHRGIPPLRNNQFGGSIGGPLIKNKIFWFGDYEGTRRRLGGSLLTRVPTAAERTGDLSALGVPIYDPNSGDANGVGRVQFADPSRATPSNPGGLNIIPQSRISTPAANAMALLPLPNVSPSNPADPNYAVSDVQKYNSNRFNIRSDVYVTDNLRLFGRYSYAGFLINSPPAFGLYGGPVLSGFNFEGASDDLNQNLAAGFNYSFGATLLTDFRFGFNRYNINVSSLDAGQPLGEQIGIPGVNISGRPDTYGLPQLNVNGAGGFNMGFQCNCPLTQLENVFQFVNNWTKISGNHTIKFGADIRHARNTRLPSDRHRSGVYTFQPTVTSAASDATSGLGLAGFIVGAPSMFERFAQLSTDQQDRQNRMFYFVQDSWRVTSKLTLNYGLRWDTWFPDYSAHAGQGGRYDVTDNLVRIPGVGGISQSADGETQWRNFSPRIGIAYAVNPKTVVRTGFGRSYFQGTFGWTFNNLAADIYPSIVNQSINQTTQFVPVFDLTTAPPPVVFPTIPSNGLLPLPDGISTPYIPANQKIPYADSWNFTVERAITESLGVAASYVGNIGRHLNGGFDLNAAVPGPGPLDPRKPLFVKYGLTQGVFDKCDCTSSNYNALQIRAQQRMSHGLSLLASYTWSKTLSYGEFGTPTDQYNAQLDYGPSDFSRTHLFTLGHDYVLPFGRGRKYLSNASGVVDGILGGWEFTGTTIIESGLPFSPGLNNQTFLNSTMSSRPDIVGDPYAGVPRDRNGWFNPAAYATPGLYTFGNAARNSLQSPKSIIPNWGLFKNFSITERVRLTFRWEVFNVFNYTNLGTPQNNVDTGSAGKIFGLAEPMRNMQFALRLGF